MIAWLRDEVGAEIVEQMILDPGNACFAHMDAIAQTGICPILFFR